MNHLAHFLVASGDRGLMAGALLADRTKGRLQGDLPPELERGINLHRAVDAFTDRHEVITGCAVLFDPPYRRYGPIMTDVIFDHFLARDWARWGPGELADFADYALTCMEGWGETIPIETRRAMARIHENQTLCRYADKAFAAPVLASIGRRMRRSNPLHTAGEQFLKYEPELEIAFTRFLPDLLDFTDSWRSKPGGEVARA